MSNFDNNSDSFFAELMAEDTYIEREAIKICALFREDYPHQAKIVTSSQRGKESYQELITPNILAYMEGVEKKEEVLARVFEKLAEVKKYSTTEMEVLDAILAADIADGGIYSDYTQWSTGVYVAAEHKIDWFGEEAEENIRYRIDNDGDLYIEIKVDGRWESISDMPKSEAAAREYMAEVKRIEEADEKLAKKENGTPKRLDDSWKDVSISTGTLREDDIIDSLGDLGKEYPALGKLIEDYHNETDEYIKSSILNEEIFDFLNTIAPEDTYFGSHPGNGSDFGFWTYEEDDDIDFEVDGE